MDVREAVKDKANYAAIVRYFAEMGNLSVEQMALLTETIENMSEEIFEHYRALQLQLRGAVKKLVNQREQTGDFSFLTGAEQQMVKEIITRGCQNGALNLEHFESYLTELK